jgi:glutaredoxin 3
MSKVVMYSKGYCPYCHAAKELLDSKAVAYEVIAIDGDENLRAEMMQRSGRHTVPQIFFGDHHVGGFDDLSAANRSGELDRLLTA